MPFPATGAVPAGLPPLPHCDGGLVWAGNGPKTVKAMVPVGSAPSASEAVTAVAVSEPAIMVPGAERPRVGATGETWTAPPVTTKLTVALTPLGAVPVRFMSCMPALSLLQSCGVDGAQADPSQ